MAPFKKKKNYCALTFTDTGIQLAQTDRKGKPVLLSACSLQSGLIRRGKIVDPDGLARAVQAFLVKSKVKTKFVAVGLPELISFSRVIVIPNLPTEEMDDAVRWELEPLLPMPIKEAYLDWMILGQTEREVQALVMALPMDLVDAYASVLEKLGYQLVAFEPTSLSLVRFAQSEGGDQLIIEVKNEEAVLVVAGGQREIHLSSTVSYADAKREDDVLETIENVLRFYRRREGEEATLANILICGEAISETLIDSIKKKTAITVERVPVEKPEFAAAISLATKNIAAPRDEHTINLIPPRIQNIYDVAEKSRSVTNWLKFWLSGLFLGVFVMGVMAARLYFENKTVEGKIIEAQAVAFGQSAPVTAQAQRLQALSLQVVSTLESARHPAETLRVIREAKGNQIQLTHFVYDAVVGQITVNGQAQERTDLIEFREKLEATGRFSTVRIPLSSLERERNADFTIILIER